MRENSERVRELCERIQDSGERERELHWDTLFIAIAKTRKMINREPKAQGITERDNRQESSQREQRESTERVRRETTITCLIPIDSIAN